MFFQKGDEVKIDLYVMKVLEDMKNEIKSLHEETKTLTDKVESLA